MILTFFIAFSSADELTSGDPSERGNGYMEVTYEDVVAVPIQWEMQKIMRTKKCKLEDCGLVLPPVVEGQKLMYIHSTPRDYVSLRRPMADFLTNWATSCYDKPALDDLLFQHPARPNVVNSFSGDISLLENPKFAVSWEKMLDQQDPKILIFLLKNYKKVLSAEKWEKILARIPKYLGCLLMTSPTDRKNPTRAKQIKNLKIAIEKHNSSCQIVSSDEEILSRGYASDQSVFKRDGTLTSYGLAQWWKMQRNHLCDTDPRLNASGSKPKTNN